MGWANCGEDSQERPIGYAHEATCDHPECETPIDRGLAYACGGMHGEETLPSSSAQVCEGYFCEKHRECVEVDDPELGGDKTRYVEVCFACLKKAPVCVCCDVPSYVLVEDLCSDCREMLEE